MNAFIGIAAFIACLALVGAWQFFEGFSRGYKKGRRDADKWWLTIEEDADQARQTIWKEEAP